jgi:phosphoglycerate kinase
MAFTFLKAQGIDIGSSLLETEMLDEAKSILAKGKDKIVLSQDFLCAASFADTQPIERTIQQGLNGVMGLDIGQKTIATFTTELNKAQTIF